MNPLSVKVNRLFSAWDSKNTPGCALGVIQGGRFIYKRCFGMANLEHGIPISPDTVFDVASTSKQFVAACIAILARKKKLSLDDEIQKHLPGMPRYSRPVTLRHLIHHTSGIRDYLGLMYLAGLRYENEYPDEEILALIARQKQLNFAPGSEHLYSNSGYLLLGEIVRRVSGMTLREYAEKQIFSPLGMKHSHFHDDFTEIVKNRASGYSTGKNGSRISVSIFDVVGDGGLNTTLNDLYIWDRNFYDNRLGGFGKGLIKELTSPGKTNGGRDLNYAFGLFTEQYRGLQTIHHGGAWLGYRCEMIRFPEHKFSVICLANDESLNAVALARRVADLYLADRFTQPAIQAAQPSRRGARQPEAAGRTGYYFNRSTGVCAAFTRTDGYGFELAGRVYKMTPLTPWRLTDDNGELQLDFETKTRLRVSPKGKQWTDYVWQPPFKLSSETLKSYAGEYYSEELGAAYKLSLKGKGLSLLRPGVPQESVSPVAKGIFKAGAYITIDTSGSGRARRRGFSLSAGRVKNLRFIKR